METKSPIFLEDFKKKRLALVGEEGLDLINCVFYSSLQLAVESVVQQSEDRESKSASGIGADAFCVNAWRRVNSPRMRCAIRPSLRLRRKEGRILC